VASKEPERPPVVLLGASANAVSAARSIGGRGVEVTVLSDGRVSGPACFSRYVRASLPPAPGEIQEHWLRWLSSAAPSVLMPCCDDGLEMLARHRPELEGLGHLVPLASDEVVLALLDKTRTYELAEAAGVATPTTVAVSSPGDLEAAADLIGFPCALKPRESHRWARTHKGKVIVAEDRTALVREGTALLGEGLSMLVTEIIPGPDWALCSYYTWMDENGEPTFNFTKRKLRQLPVSFGTGTYHVTAWDPEVAEEGLLLFTKLGLRGVGNVEFKRDARDGRLVLIECNLRLTAANELVRRSGIDLAWFVYCRTVGLPEPDVSSFRDGVYQWLPSRDLLALRDYRREGVLSVGGWARSLAHRQTFALFSWSDPRPAVTMVGRRIAELAGRGR
jgi:D-aspartate ligase